MAPIFAPKGVILVLNAAGVHGVVGLTAEEEVGDEAVADVLGFGDARVGEFVELLRGVLRGEHAGRAQRLLDLFELAHRLLVAVGGEEIHDAVLVEQSRVDVLQRLGVALLPAGDDAAVEVGGPSRAAFQEAHAELGEAVSDAAEEQRLAEQIGRVGEVAEMVLHEVVGVRVVGEAEAAVVRRQGQPKLDGLGPDRVVVVLAILAERVEPPAVPRHGAGMPRLDLADRPADVARDHGGLQPELPHGELHLLDGLLWGVHRDECRRGQSRRVGP